MAQMFKNFAQGLNKNPDSVFPSKDKSKETKDFLPNPTNEEMVQNLKKEITDLTKEQHTEMILELESHRNDLEKRLKPEVYQDLLKTLKAEKGH